MTTEPEASKGLRDFLWQTLEHCPERWATVDLIQEYIEEQVIQQRDTPPKSPEVDLTKCPSCGGDADNGHDGCFPPNPYNCTKCEEAITHDVNPSGDALLDLMKEFFVIVETDYNWNLAHYPPAIRYCYEAATQQGGNFVMGYDLVEPDDDLSCLAIGERKPDNSLIVHYCIYGEEAETLYRTLNKVPALKAALTPAVTRSDEGQIGYEPRSVRLSRELSETVTQQGGDVDRALIGLGVIEEIFLNQNSGTVWPGIFQNIKAALTPAPMPEIEGLDEAINKLEEAARVWGFDDPGIICEAARRYAQGMKPAPVTQEAAKDALGWINYLTKNAQSHIKDYPNNSGKLKEAVKHYDVIRAVLQHHAGRSE